MKDNRFINLIKDGFFHIMGGSILIKLMGFISSVVVVRLLSKEAYGCLAYADNLFSYVSIISGLGMSTAIIIKCSNRIEECENMKYFNYAIYRGSIVQIIGSLFILIYFFVFDTEFRDAGHIMISLCVYPLIAYIVQCVTNYARAYQENKLYSKAAVIQSLVLLISSIAFSVFLDAIGVVIARYVASIVLIFVLLNFLSKHINFQVPQLNSLEKRNFISLSLSLLIASFFSELMYSNEMLLVNKIIASESVTAEYKISTLIPSQIMFVTQSLLIYFIPKFVYYQKKHKELWWYSCKVGLFNFIIVSFVCFFAILFTPLMIKVLYGDEYFNTIGLSIKFWIAYGINAGFRMIPLNVLASTGGEKINAVLSVIGCVIHFLIAWFTLTVIGIEILPVAMSIVYIFVGCCAWFALLFKCRRNQKKNEY